eukprot:COSAG01_NODE_5224_length_4401_cov_157.385170_2_plen_71_part_00
MCAPADKRREQREGLGGVPQECGRRGGVLCRGGERTNCWQLVSVCVFCLCVLCTWQACNHPVARPPPEYY